MKRARDEEEAEAETETQTHGMAKAIKQHMEGADATGPSSTAQYMLLSSLFLAMQRDIGPLTTFWGQVVQDRAVMCTAPFLPHLKELLPRHLTWALLSEPTGWNLVKVCCEAWKVVCVDDLRCCQQCYFVCDAWETCHSEDADAKYAALWAYADLVHCVLERTNDLGNWSKDMLMNVKLLRMLEEVCNKIWDGKDDARTSPMQTLVASMVLLVEDTGKLTMAVRKKVFRMLVSWATPRYDDYFDNVDMDLIVKALAHTVVQSPPSCEEDKQILESFDWLLQYIAATYCYRSFRCAHNSVCDMHRAYMSLWISTKHMHQTRTRFVSTGLMHALTAKHLVTREQCVDCWKTTVDVLVGMTSNDHDVAASFLAANGPVTALRQAIARSCVHAQRQCLDLIEYLSKQEHSKAALMDMLTRSACFLQDLQSLMLQKEEPRQRLRARRLFEHLLNFSGAVCTTSWDLVTGGAVAPIVAALVAEDIQAMTVPAEVRFEADRLRRGNNAVTAVVAHEEYRQIFEVAMRGSHVVDIVSAWAKVCITQVQRRDVLHRASVQCVLFEKDEDAEKLKTWCSLRGRLWTGFRLVDPRFCRLFVFLSTIVGSSFSECCPWREYFPRVATFAPSEADRREARMLRFSDLKISSCADVINLMNVDATGNECCVCSSASTEGSPVRRLPCEHCMCDMCLDKWMLARKKNQDAMTCPVCRAQIITALRPVMDLCDRVAV